MAYQRYPILWVKIAVSKTGTLPLRLKLHPKLFPHLSALHGVTMRCFWDLIHSLRLKEFNNNKPSVVLYEVIVTVKGLVKFPDTKESEEAIALRINCGFQRSDRISTTR